MFRSHFLPPLLTGYRVFLRCNNEEWKSRETLAEGKDATHTIHGLKCGTKYQVYLLAFNEVGNSEPSESLAFATDGGGKRMHFFSSSLSLSLYFFIYFLSPNITRLYPSSVESIFLFFHCVSVCPALKGSPLASC